MQFDRSTALLQALRGFCMGSADIVPGVSGGTVALVFGIYAELVRQIRQGARSLGRLARADLGGFVRELKAVDWWFLLPLLAGILTAVGSLAFVITYFLDNEPRRTAALFFGLVLGSILTTMPMVRHWDLRHVGLAAVVAVSAFLLLGLRGEAIEHPALVVVLGGGMLAICAMILPGISGSFILLMLGLYDSITTSLKDGDLAVLSVFAVGAVIGLGGFSSLLTWALEKHEQLLLAGLIGLMTGSLRVLWPWPDGTESTTFEAPSGDTIVPIALMVFGVLLIIAIARVARVREIQTEPAEV